MSIASSLAGIQTAKSDIAAAIKSKNVSVSSTAKLADYAALIDKISSSAGSLTDANIDIYIADYYNDEVDTTYGVVDVYKRVIVS